MAYHLTGGRGSYRHSACRRRHAQKGTRRLRKPLRSYHQACQPSNRLSGWPLRVEARSYHKLRRAAYIPKAASIGEWIVCIRPGLRPRLRLRSTGPRLHYSQLFRRDRDARVVGVASDRMGKRVRGLDLRLRHINHVPLSCSPITKWTPPPAAPRRIGSPTSY